MDNAAIEPELGQRFENCTRCLQPVPVRAARCPGCGQPYKNRRWVPLTIGTIGLLALIFVMGLMYYATWRADLDQAEILADPDGEPQEIMVKVPDSNSKPAAPPAPEKKPPLNDK
jgi:hypothetical protein